MVRPGYKWVTTFALLFLIFVLPSTAVAQPAEVNDPPEAVEEAVETTDNPSENEILPPDLVTRESFQETPDEQPRATLGWKDYVNMFVSLGIVLLVIWGISVLFKRFVSVRGLATTTESLKILYTMSLSPTRTLYLVRLGDRILLIGAGDGGMRTLSEISNPDEVAAIIREIEYKGNFDLNPFRDRLQSIIGEDEKSDLNKDDFKERQRKLKGSMEKLKNHDDAET